MRQHARSGAKDEGSTYEVLILMATDAREVQSVLDAPLWLVQRRLHSWESRPKETAALFILKAAARMTLASIETQISGGRGPVVHLELYMSSFGIIHELYTGWLTGCLLVSDSLTVGEFGSSGLTGSSRWRILPFSFLDKRSRAAYEHQVGI